MAHVGTGPPGVPTTSPHRQRRATAAATSFLQTGRWTRRAVFLCRRWGVCFIHSTLHCATVVIGSLPLEAACSAWHQCRAFFLGSGGVTNGSGGTNSSRSLSRWWHDHLCPIVRRLAAAALPVLQAVLPHPLIVRFVWPLLSSNDPAVHTTSSSGSARGRSQPEALTTTDQGASSSEDASEDEESQGGGGGGNAATRGGIPRPRGASLSSADRAQGIIRYEAADHRILAAFGFTSFEGNCEGGGGGGETGVGGATGGGGGEPNLAGTPFVTSPFSSPSSPFSSASSRETAAASAPNPNTTNAAAAAPTTTTTFSKQLRERYNGPAYNGHVATVLGQWARPAPACIGTAHANPVTDPLYRYHREIISSNRDGQHLALDWRYADGSTIAAVGGDSSPLETVVVCPHARGVVLLVPGMGSTSLSPYIAGFARHATAEGFHVCVLNLRGKNGPPLTEPLLVSASFTDDIRTVARKRLTPEFIGRKFARSLEAAREQRMQQGYVFVDGEYILVDEEEDGVSGNRGSLSPVLAKHASGTALPALAVGFSIGGMQLIRYLAEDASSLMPLHAAVTVHAPIDFRASFYHGMSTTIGRRVYSPRLARGWMDYLHANKAVFLQARSGVHASVKALLQDPRGPAAVTDLEAYDTQVLCPQYGFTTFDGYLRAMDALPLLPAVRCPLLLVSSADDVFTGPPPSSRRLGPIAARNPHLLFLTVPFGGHLGFLNGPLAALRDEPTWMERRVVQALTVIAQQQQRR